MADKEENGLGKKIYNKAVDIIAMPSAGLFGAALGAPDAVDQFAHDNIKAYRDSKYPKLSSRKGIGYRNAKSLIKTGLSMDTTNEELAERREKSTPQAGYKKGGSVAPRGWGKARVKRK